MRTWKSDGKRVINPEGNLFLDECIKSEEIAVKFNRLDQLERDSRRLSSKSPSVKVGFYGNLYDCPVCNNRLHTGRFDRQRYCSECGQAIEWDGVE